MYKLIRPLLFSCDPERMHELSIWLAKHAWKAPLQWIYGYNNEKLNTTVLDITFSNPVGLAAGFDKNAELIDFLPALGFGFLEIGSVTAKPCDGNQKPRLFRAQKDEGLINNMGLNNIGADAVRERLMGRRFSVPIGMNIAKTNDPQIMGDKAIEDICYTVEKLSPVADYITLNISCPNTKSGKTFEDKNALEELLSAIKTAKSFFLKISPEISYQKLDGILEVSKGYGYVISNTLRHERGGLSGKPLQKKSTEMIHYVYRHMHQPAIIGVGGIFSAEDAYEKILAGASLVQIYTGLVYEGPGIVKKIKQGLVQSLEHKGFASLRHAIGTH